MHQAKPSTPNQKTPKVSETKFTNPFRERQVHTPKPLTKVTILVPPQGRCIQINRVRNSPKMTKNHCMIEISKTRKDKSQVFVLKT